MVAKANGQDLQGNRGALGTPNPPGRSSKSLFLSTDPCNPLRLYATNPPIAPLEAFGRQKFPGPGRGLLKLGDTQYHVRIPESHPLCRHSPMHHRTHRDPDTKPSLLLEVRASADYLVRVRTRKDLFLNTCDAGTVSTCKPSPE